MITENSDSFNQLNLDEDFPVRNTLSILAPKQKDLKICDLMNESFGNSSNRTKVKPTDDILCTVNNNFVNTANTKDKPTDDILCTVNNNFVNIANNEFFNTMNVEFLNEIKSPTQLNELEVNTNVTDIDFIVNCSTKNTDCVISNTDNTSEEVLSESYLEKVI